jgi:hypothetical protein
MTVVAQTELSDALSVYSFSGDYFLGSSWLKSTTFPHVMDPVKFDSR